MDKKLPREAVKKKTARKRRKGLIKRIIIRTIAGIFFAAGLFVVAIVGLIAGSLAGYVEETELVDIENMRLNLTSYVYVLDPETGEYVEYEELFDTENRRWVPSSEIPEHLKNAFVAIEDERFYSHSGVDIKRFAGAAFEFLSNKGSSSYGGSTITQQLIKNLTQDDDYTIKRKVQEVYRAYNLEKELSKDEILEYYLNTIYLSQKCNGVGSASYTYFGKNVSELSLAECAVIAGITKFPTKYDPLVNPENNRDRQLVILKKMLELGFITEKEYNEAKAEELQFMLPKSQQEQHVQTYFVDAAIEQVIEDLIDKYDYSRENALRILYNGGLKIYLSLDSTIQKHMEDVYKDPEAFQKANTEVQPQSSMVIMDPYTGLVKGLVGGRGEKEANRTLNRATQTLRQPGSTIKPLSVYAPAVEYGLVTPNSIVNDAAVTYGKWSPRNDDRSFKGRITVATALRGSRNVPATKICDYLTTDAAYDFLKNNLHVGTVVDGLEKNGKVYSDKGLASIALGGLTEGVTVLDMCAAYCVFPNGGKYIKPSLYTKVVDSRGKVILEHKSTELIAMSESTAESMIGMLEGVVTGGTGTSARISGMRVAGKTGTTSSNHDRWFIGFTPYYVGAVWFGYDNPAPLKNFSPNPAAVAWRKVMTPIHENLVNKPFLSDEADGKYSIMICADSGMRATPSCNHLTSRTYNKGQIPRQMCVEHPYTFNKNKLEEGKTKEDVEGIIIDDGGGGIIVNDIPLDNTDGIVPGDFAPVPDDIVPNPTPPTENVVPTPPPTENVAPTPPPTENVVPTPPPAESVVPTPPPTENVAPTPPPSAPPVESAPPSPAPVQ